MSQSTITSYFNSRKRPASEEMVSSKSKLLHVDSCLEPRVKKGRHVLSKNLDLLGKDIKQQVYLVNQSKLGEQKAQVNACPQQRSPTKAQQQEPKVSTPFAKKVNAANVEKNNETPKSAVITSARKELSLGDIRKKLATSSRLQELKATAERLSKGIQEVKDTCEKRNLKEFKSFDVEVPSSPSKKSTIQNDLLTPKKELLFSQTQRPFISPRKVFVSPVKSPSKIPAYIRHASLATSSTSLPLPHQYRFLAELFRGMETVVAMLYNRNEKVTFNKLKPSVQEMLKRNFTEKHLAEIKHLVPDFYNFNVQKNKNFATSSQKDSYELVITPNFPNDIQVMNPTVLLERRRYFYDTLLKLVKKHHAQYLLTLDPPMMIPDDKLTRWHPEFEIEKVPEVECAKLPEMPNNEKLSTAQDVLSKARELFKCNTKMERALERLAQAKARGLTEQEKAVASITADKPTTDKCTAPTSQLSTSGVTIINPALRNLPTALLEKVKAKQAAKALEAMTRSSQHEQNYLIYSRLPDLTRTLRNIFVTERKNVLALNIILSKLDSSFKSKVSANALLRDIKVLAEETPEWLKLHDIRNTTYLKLDKNADLNNIVSKLEALAAKYKND